MPAFVHPTAEVEGAEVGEDSKVWHQAQLLAGASLGRECTSANAEPPIPAQLRTFADLVLGRLDPADVLACASLADGQYAVEVAARATLALSG